MIDADLTAKTSLRDLAQQLPRNMRVAFRKRVETDAVPIVQDLLIDKLVNETPPRRTPSSPKFVWSRGKRANNRARRWWFAAIARGEIRTDGHNYIRSGTLQKKWRVYAKVTTDAVTIQVINRGKGAKFVYGNRERPQIPGHRVTGWPSINRQLAAKQRTLDSKIRKVYDAIVVEGTRV